MAFTRSTTLAKKLAALMTSTALGATALVSLTFVATSTSVTPVHAAGLGGPVQLDGMDPVCHSGGESTGQYIAAVLKSLHDQATISGSDGSIAILGAGVSNACGESMDSSDPSNFVDGQYLNDFSAPKPSWSLYSSATDVENFFTDLAAGTINPKVIWMPDDWNRSNDVEAAFTAHAEDIANFVNAGGGLFSNMGQYGWLSSLLPQAQYVGGGCNGGPALSIDGQNAFPTLTDTMVQACWHGSFWGSYTGLVSLVEWPYDALNTGATPTPMAAVAIGGANVTMPTSFKLETNPPQAIPSDTVDVIASAIGLDGTIYSGVTVSFSITSGPHAGWTATATTGSDGLAHASLTYLADGSDVIEASATVNGSAKTQVYTLDWATAFTPTRYVDAVLGTMTQYTPYSNGVAADGRPAPTYAITSGALPAGLSLNGATGAITGTPTTSGAFSFEITATNPAGTASKTFTGSVAAGTAPLTVAPSWTDTTMGSITRSIAFSDGVAASGTPDATYSITAGSLPAGLTLDPATGAITGTPSAGGSYSFEVTASNSAGTVTHTFSGSVADPTPSWTDSTIADFSLAVPYSNGVEASSSQGVSYSITAGSLPAGLTLDPATGAITGTPTAAGAYSFEVTATATGTSPALVVSVTFSGTVEDTTPSWTDAALDDIHAGVPYSDGLTGNSSLPVTYSITAGSLPAGLTLDPATGAITGTVASPGAYSFEVTATSDGGSVSRTFSGSVIATPPTVGDSIVANGVVGVGYSDSVSGSATSAVTYSITAGSLPAGLTLDPATGAITGTPTAAGTFSFSVTVSSASGSSDIALTIVIVSMDFEPTKDVNNVGSETGSIDFSSAPAGSSISVTPPVGTNSLSAGSAALVGSSVVFTPETGFSGYAKIMVTITVNGHSETREYTFTVNPAPVGLGEYSHVPAKATAAWLNSPRASGGTSISWQASPNAVSYEVWDMSGVSAAGVRTFSGKLLCRTSSTSCTLPLIAGPSTAFQVVATGRDDLRSTVVSASYKPAASRQGAKVLNAQFAADSYKLSAVMKAELKVLAKQVKAGGYKRIYLSGNADDRGAVWYNRYLGSKRASAVKSYLEQLLPGVRFTMVSKGSTDPVSKKQTEQARVLNRRVDVYLAA